MKTIVFGGSGFIGSHVADILSGRGHEVIIFDIKPSAYLKPDQEMVVGDILDFEGVKRAVKGCDYVYNFAGIANLDNAATKPVETVRQNIIGAVNILEACKEAEVKRFVYASTIYVYSQQGGFYRCSKQAAELYIEEYWERYGLGYNILRYGTVYGLRADSGNSIFRYLDQALREKKVSCSGSGEEIREYINVKDAAALSVDILTREYKNQHITITGHRSMTLRDFLNNVNDVLNGSVKVMYEPEKRSPHHYVITPYSYQPREGRKLTGNCYIDLSQGLLECIQEMSVKAKL